SPCLNGRGGMASSRPGGRRKKDAAPAKRPFDVETAVERLREAVRPYPKAALFELAAEGHGSLFEILVACIISIRTRDETTLPVARQLFARARTPAEMVKLSPDEIDRLIGACTFHEPKAKQIHEIARETVDGHGAEVFDLSTAGHVPPGWRHRASLSPSRLRPAVSV